MTSLSLHSHARQYEHPDSSKQQQVTAYSASNDDDYWIVKGPHNFPESYKTGEVVRNGDIIRLEHMSTSKNLHSHNGFPAPVSNDQHEVTAFGEDGIGDINDNWKVDIENSGIWEQGLRVKLIQQKTNFALHSHDKKLPEYGFGQQEVTGYDGRDRNDWWRAAIFQDVNGI